MPPGRLRCARFPHFHILAFSTFGASSYLCPMKASTFIEELKWRGMLQDMTPGLEEHLATGKRKAYIGFDPTAPSLTIGNYVPIMLLTFFQRAGHQPVVLLGGATGRIGDPSGKDAERQLKSYEELDRNTRFQEQQFLKLLNFDEGENKALLFNNLDFYKDMNVLDFLRDVGKTLTVNYMMSKESVKKRLETGLSFTEFSYQLLQGYDFFKLYAEHDITIQMGGSDQWGNITSGTEFIRKKADGEAFALTAPLLTKADGKKFGKSEQGNIWLDPEMTSPYQFYQFWINADDRDLPKYFRYFSLKSREEIEALEQEHRDNPRALKALLAEELCTRIHGRNAYEAARKVSSLLFNHRLQREELLQMPEEVLREVAREIPRYTVSRERLSANPTLAELLTETGILPSKSEVRRNLQAIALNKQKYTSHEDVVSSDILLHQRYVLVEKGKKNKFMLLAE